MPFVLLITLLESLIAANAINDYWTEPAGFWKSLYLIAPQIGSALILLRHFGNPLALRAGGALLTAVLAFMCWTGTHENLGSYLIFTTLCLSVIAVILLSAAAHNPDWQHGLYLRTRNLAWVLGAGMLMAGATLLVVYLAEKLIQTLLPGFNLSETLRLSLALAGGNLGLYLALYRLPGTQIRWDAIPHFLLSLSGGSTLVFLALLLKTGLAPLWETGYATPILLLMNAINLVLILSLTQPRLTQPNWVRHGTRLIALTSPVLAGLAAYCTALRVQQYGLSPERCYAVLITGFNLLCSLVVVFMVLRYPSQWGLQLHRALTPVLEIACLLIVGSLLPGFNASSLSAESQIQRLLTGQIPASTFNFDTLKRWGASGREALAELPKRLPESSLPEAERNIALQRLEQQRIHGETPIQHPLNLTWGTTPHPDIPEAVLRKHFPRATHLTLNTLDIDDDGNLELLVLADDFGTLTTFRMPSWKPMTLNWSYLGAEQRKAFAKGDIKLLPPLKTYPLQIGDKVLYPTPARDFP